MLQYQKGAVDFNRYALIEQNLVTQQDSAAQARGQIAQGLIATYRALGGGWEIRLGDNAAVPPPPAGPDPVEESPHRCPARPPPSQPAGRLTPTQSAAGRANARASRPASPTPR